MRLLPSFFPNSFIRVLALFLRVLSGPCDLLSSLSSSSPALPLLYSFFHHTIFVSLMRLCWLPHSSLFFFLHFDLNYHSLLAEMFFQSSYWSKIFNFSQDFHKNGAKSLSFCIFLCEGLYSMSLYLALMSKCSCNEKILFVIYIYVRIYLESTIYTHQHCAIWQQEQFSWSIEAHFVQVFSFETITWSGYLKSWTALVCLIRGWISLIRPFCVHAMRPFSFFFIVKGDGARQSENNRFR